MVNLQIWQALRQETRDLISMACRASVTSALSESGAAQGEVIKNFSSQGITAETLPREMLEALRDVATEILDEEAAKNEWFATILASQREFSDTYGYWKRKGYLPRDF